MKALIVCALLIGPVMEHCQAQESEKSNEEIMKAYFSGWVANNWNEVASHLAESFTFTSAAPDDHLPADKFKAKCWTQAEHIHHFEFPQIISHGNETFAIVHVVTRDKQVIRNVEYFVFEKGKIKSIEVFFGGNGRGFPTNNNK